MIKGLRKSKYGNTDMIVNLVESMKQITGYPYRHVCYICKIKYGYFKFLKNERESMLKEIDQSIYK